MPMHGYSVAISASERLVPLPLVRIASASAPRLVDETPVTGQFYDWTGIERIEADDQFIYVIVDSKSLFRQRR